MVQFRLLIGHVLSKLGDRGLAYMQLAALHITSDKQSPSVSSPGSKERDNRVSLLFSAKTADYQSVISSREALQELAHGVLWAG
jgi:hypothetical protein